MRAGAHGGRGRTGVFGGSFDPIHHGHLAAAQEVLEVLGLDRILFVPAHRSPFREEGGSTPPEVRLRMVREATALHPGFETSDLELLRPPPSYTVDTLRELGERGVQGMHLILGTDQWGAFSRWRSPMEVAELARLVLVTREGGRPAGVDPGFGDSPPPYLEVEVTRLDISSSLVRERVRGGRSIRFLVPEGVRRIIEREKLYR